MVPPTPDPLPGPSPVTFCTCEIYGVFYMAAACLEGRGGEVWGRHRSNPGIWGPPHAGGPVSLGGGDMHVQGPDP